MSEFRDMAEAINARLAYDRSDHWFRTAIARIWVNIGGFPVDVRDPLEAGAAELQRLCVEYARPEWERLLARKAREQALDLALDLGGSRLDQRKRRFKFVSHLLRMIRWNYIDRYLSHRVHETQRIDVTIHKKHRQGDDQPAICPVEAGVLEGLVSKGCQAAIMVVDTALEAGDQLVLTFKGRGHLPRKIRIHLVASSAAGEVQP